MDLAEMVFIIGVMVFVVMALSHSFFWARGDIQLSDLKNALQALEGPSCSFRDFKIENAMLRFRFSRAYDQAKHGVIYEEMRDVLESTNMSVADYRRVGRRFLNVLNGRELPIAEVVSVDEKPMNIHQA